MFVVERSQAVRCLWCPVAASLEAWQIDQVRLGGIRGWQLGWGAQSH